MPTVQPTALFPFTVKVQKCSGNSLYVIVPKQIVQAKKIVKGVTASLRLRDDGVMEVLFDA
jgi:antitoxin component of MazEF toxin-antitoxin module